jgi:hypothetical protein
MSALSLLSGVPMNEEQRGLLSIGESKIFQLNEN